WFVMSIYFPPTTPSSTSRASGLRFGGIFETRSRFSGRSYRVWDQFPASIRDDKFRADITAFINNYSPSTEPGPWEDVFTQEQVAAAVDALIAILTKAGTSCYAMPDEETLSHLVRMLEERIPPCGSDLSGSETPVNRSVDFRHILLAGWLVADKVNATADSAEQRKQFLQLNKLCEMGLLQQRAIDLYNSEEDREAA
ncbi:MAG: hypothetical protein WA539_02745, partial [Candidatus Sulfotelmatobacter sp.]